MPRRPDQLRPLRITPFPTGSPGSVLIEAGNTRVICTASLSDDTPAWLLDKATGQPRHGWVTAEYAMLPGSTPSRKKRGPDSRATEIQRLIGRVLRAAVDLNAMPGLLVSIDCDVVSADGGTRTAAITGGCVALAHALAQARRKGLITGDPMKGRGPVAAVSVGLVDGRPHLDLDYPLDARADVDLNVALDAAGRIIEVQGAAEHAPFTRAQLDTLLNLATAGIRKIQRIQRRAMNP